MRYQRSYLGAESEVHDFFVPRKKYGFLKFMGDILMTLLTHGVWIIWIFVREMRKR